MADYPGKNWISEQMDKYADDKYKEELEWLYSEIEAHQKYTAELEAIVAELRRTYH